MSQAPRDAIEAMLREVPLDAGGDLHVQRPLFEEFMRQQPLPDDPRLADGALGGVPILDIAAPEAAADARVLYFHGGVFALGSARAGGRSMTESCGREFDRAAQCQHRSAAACADRRSALTTRPLGVPR